MMNEKQKAFLTRSLGTTHKRNRDDKAKEKDWATKSQQYC